MDFYTEKFTSANLYHTLKSLVWFDDADKQAELEMLIPADWSQVKKHISEEEWSGQVIPEIEQITNSYKEEVLNKQ